MQNDDFSPSPVPMEEEAVNLRQYWHIILERRWLVIAAFVSVFALSLIYLFKATPIYRAEARLKINRETENILRLEGFSVAPQQDQDYLQTQYKNLLSRSLIQQVITALKLDKDEYYGKESVDIVKAVADSVTVSPIRLSRLVEVKAEHPDRNKARDIVNTLINRFIQRHVDEKTGASAEVENRLKQEAEVQKRKWEDAQNKLNDFLKQEKNVSFDDAQNIVLQELVQYSQQHAAANGEAETAQQIVQQVTRMLEDGSTPIGAIPHVQRDAEMQALNRELLVLRAEFDGLSKLYLSENPKYVVAQQRIETLEASIGRRATNIIESLKNHALIARRNADRLRVLVAQQESKQLALKEKKITYDVLKRESDQSERLYMLVVDSLKQSEIASKNKISNILVVDPAETPIKPVKPRWVLTILLGIVGGLGVAIGLAFFVNYLDDSIKSQEDVESYLRLPFLGYVPNIKTNSVVERDLQAHLHPQSNAAEGFRTIRATLSLAHKADKLRMVAVTSTIPSEGKSLVASNFAIVLAQTGLKTLLVDADLRRPSVHKAFQLHSPVGLSSFLSGETDTLDKITHKTEVPNLDVICCGAVPATPSELIGSEEMTRFLEQARSRYDRVVLDCPPISAVSDPLVIAARAEGVVFVTKFNKIRREHAKKSVNRLQNAGIHILGVVLNDIDFEGKDSYYYSYYYYQNRYYASHYKTTPDRPAGSPSPGRSVEEVAPSSRNGGNGAV